MRAGYSFCRSALGVSSEHTGARSTACLAAMKPTRSDIMPGADVLQINVPSRPCVIRRCSPSGTTSSACSFRTGAPPCCDCRCSTLTPPRCAVADTRGTKSRPSGVSGSLSSHFAPRLAPRVLGTALHYSTRLASANHRMTRRVQVHDLLGTAELRMSDVHNIPRTAWLRLEMPRNSKQAEWLVTCSGKSYDKATEAAR